MTAFVLFLARLVIYALSALMLMISAQLIADTPTVPHVGYFACLGAVFAIVTVTRLIRNGDL